MSDPAAGAGAASSGATCPPLDLHQYSDRIPASLLHTELGDSKTSQQQEVEITPAVDTERLCSWLSVNVVCEELVQAHTVVLLVDTKPLGDYDFFKRTIGALWHQRSRFMHRERLHVVFVPCLDENSLRTCHMTHAFVHVARALRVRFPGKHIIATDADCGPCSLIEVWEQVQLARALEELRLQESLPSDHMPGVILHNEKDAARSNAGLVIFPGLGDYLSDLAEGGGGWSSLCMHRLEHILNASATRELSSKGYEAHLQSWASGTPLSGILVEEPQDYLHIATLILDVLNMSAWSPNATREDRACLAAFSDSIRLAIPRLNGWAGPFCEQPALSFLEAFQTRSCYITYLPSELGFMKKFVSSRLGTRDNCHGPAVMPPIYVHGYGRAAKKALCNVQLDYWVTFEQSMQGSLLWLPNFLDAGVGDTAHVQVSCGFGADVKVPDVKRSVVAADFWSEVVPSCNQAFLDQLPPAVLSESTWPLWHTLVDHNRTVTPVDDGHPIDQRHESRAVCIECPGLSMSTVAGYSDLFDEAPEIIFQNAGPKAVYGPTREPAWYNSHCRAADTSLNALHYILRDEPCLEAFRTIFAHMNLPDFPKNAESHPVPFCESWHAPPCSSVTLSLLALVSQYTRRADSWLVPFFSGPFVLQNLAEEDRLCDDAPVTNLEIRGFSAGSYTGVFLFRLLQHWKFPFAIEVKAVVGALALPAEQVPSSCTALRIIHVVQDKACHWNPSAETQENLRSRSLDLLLISCEGMLCAKEVLKKSFHNYSYLVRGHENLLPCAHTISLQHALAHVVMPAVGDNAKYFWLFLAWSMLSRQVPRSVTDILSLQANEQLPPSFRKVLAHFLSGTSAEHISFFTTLVFPWVASGVVTQGSRDHDLCKKTSTEEVKATVEIMSKLAPDTAVVKLWFSGNRNVQDGWASWEDAQPGFFNGEQLEGSFRTASTSFPFRSVITQVRWNKSFSTIREMEMLVQITSSSRDAVMDLYTHGSVYNLDELQKTISRVVADPRMRLLALDPSLLRLVWGKNDLPVLPAKDPQMHPKTSSINHVALSWENASRKLQTCYPEVLEDMSVGLFDRLWKLIRGSDPLDMELHQVWQPLDSLGKAFAMMFWTILAQPASPLPRFLAHIGISMWKMVKAAHVQGVPGSGKTTIMAIITICLCVQMDMCVLWTAVNINAVQEGAERLSSLLVDAAPWIKEKFVRCLGMRHEETCDIDVPFLARRKAIGPELGYKVILMTEDGLLAEHGFSFTKLFPEVDISLKDEAQQGGTPAHAFQVSFLKGCGLSVNVGDHMQTKLAVDSRNTAMRVLVAGILDRDPGMRGRSLTYVALPKWENEMCNFFGLEPQGNGLVCILQHVLQTSSAPPADVDVQSARSGAYPQISLAASLRNPSFAYSLYIAAEYHNLVEWHQSDQDSTFSVELGVEPPASHDSLKHVDKELPQVVWVQPWGEALQADMCGHMRNALAILSYMCFNHGQRYSGKNPVGIVVSHRKLFDALRNHFDQDANLQLSAMRVVQEASLYEINPDLNPLENLRGLLSKNHVSEVSLQDVCHAIERAPWLVKYCIRVNVAMSAVGSQRLDVLMYRIPGRFVDRNDQTVVACSRHQGHLYIFCDVNRVRQMLARLASMIFRTCPVLYFTARLADTVTQRACSLSALRPPSSVLRRADTMRLISQASNSWESVPLAVGVVVTCTSGETHTRLLLARPYTPCHRRWCRAPEHFWLDSYTTWSWEADGKPREALRNLGDYLWCIRPRAPNWIFLIAGKVVALKSHAASQQVAFHMNVVEQAGALSEFLCPRPMLSAGFAQQRLNVAAVQVSVLPPYVFPTQARWAAEDILAVMPCDPETQTALAEASDVQNAESSLVSETTQSRLGAELYDKDAVQEISQQDNDVLVFSEFAVEMHGRAQHVFDSTPDIMTADLSSDVANQIKLGYSVDAPWCVVTFRMEQLLESLTKAKLARLLTMLSEERVLNLGGDASRGVSLLSQSLPALPELMLSDLLLFDSLAEIFSDILSVLDGTEPAWWKDLLPDIPFSTLWSVAFVKFQLMVSLRNMSKPREFYDPTMFFFTRQTISMGLNKDCVLRVPDRLRLQLPAGLALFLRHIFTQQVLPDVFTNSLCFQIQPRGEGGNIVLHLKKKLVEERFQIFRTSQPLMNLVRTGMSERVLGAVGGIIDPPIVRLQSVCPVEHRKSSSKTVNCNTFRTYFDQFAQSDKESVSREGAQLVGATHDSLRVYIASINSALSMDAAYKQRQLESFDVESYLRDGMPFKKLSDGSKTYLAFIIFFCFCA